MERALLEGEHQMEMEELEREQQTINRLKHRQLELIDQATAEREKVRKKLNKDDFFLLIQLTIHLFMRVPYVSFP